MNRIILGVLALFATAFAIAFVADLRGYFNVPISPVAYVESIDGTVRRLPHNQLTWDRASQGSLFAAKDTIQTGESGYARLVFYAGGELELGPGAMVALSGNVEEVQLNFISGTGRVRLAKKSKSKIKIAQTKPKATGSIGNQPIKPSRVKIEVVEKVEVAKAPTKEEIDKGKVETPKLEEVKIAKKKTKEKKSFVKEALEKAKNQLTKEISEEEVKTKKNILKTDGKVISTFKVPTTPELVFPPEDASIDIDKTKRASFQWKSPEKDKVKRYELTVKSTESFGKENASRTYRLKNPKFALRKIKSGKYLWSVRAVNQKGRRGPASEFRFVEIVASKQEARKQEGLRLKRKSKPKPKPKQISRPSVMPVRIE